MLLISFSKNLKPVLAAMFFAVGTVCGGYGLFCPAKVFAGEVIPFPKPSAPRSEAQSSLGELGVQNSPDNVLCIGALVTVDSKALHNRLFAALEALGPLGLTSREFDLKLRKLKSVKIYGSLVDALEAYNQGAANVLDSGLTQRLSSSLRLGLFNIYRLLPALNTPEQDPSGNITQIEPLLKAMIFIGEVVRKYSVTQKAEPRFQKEDAQFFDRILWMGQEYLFSQISTQNFPAESEIFRSKIELIMIIPFATLRREDEFSFHRIREIITAVGDENNLALFARYLDLANKVLFFWTHLRYLEHVLVDQNHLPLGADYRSDSVLVYISERMKSRDFSYLTQVEALIGKHTGALLAKLSVAIRHDIYGEFMEDATAKNLISMYLSFQEDLKDLDVPQ